MTCEQETLILENYDKIPYRDLLKLVKKGKKAVDEFLATKGLKRPAFAVKPGHPWREKNSTLPDYSLKNLNKKRYNYL